MPRILYFSRVSVVDGITLGYYWLGKRMVLSVWTVKALVGIRWAEEEVGDA